MKTTTFGLWIVMFWPMFAEAGELVFKPVQVGPEGPLLFFTHPEDEQGKSVGGSGPRNEVLYLYDPSYHDKPQQLWLRDRPPAPRPIVRLKQNLVLMTTVDDHCFFLHLDTGAISPLLPGPEETELIHIERDKVLFLKREVPQARTGYRLGRKRGGIPELADRVIGTKWSGPTVAKQDQRSRDYLHVFAPSLKSPVQLVTVPLEKVLTIGKDAIWAITAERTWQLVRISKLGALEEIIAVNDHWVVSETRHAFSPDGKYLALSCLHDQHDFHDERQLVVIDLTKKRVAYSKERIALDDAGDSATPYLHFRWLNETHLSYGLFFESSVVDVTKGTTAEGEAADVLERRYQGQDQPEPKRKKHGLFDYEWGLLYFAGEQQPIASVLDKLGSQVNDLAICPDGKWAAFTSPVDRHTYLVDGGARKKAVMIHGWSYDITWVPDARHEVKAAPRPRNR